jgi:GT2 family glycosyltransferase
MSAPRVSVVVNSPRRAEDSERILAALEGQSVPRRCFEVLVVEADERTGVERIRAPRALAPPWLKRAPAARGELVLLLGSSLAPEPDLLERHLALHDANGGPVATIGRVLEARDRRPTPFARYLEQGVDLDLPELDDGDGPLPASALHTDNLCLPRRALLEAYAPDPGFEAEVGMRLTLAGFRLLFAGRAHARRIHPMELLELCALEEQRGYERAIASARHPDVVPPAEVRDEAHSSYLPFTERDLFEWHEMLRRLEGLPEYCRPSIDQQDPVGRRVSTRSLDWFYRRILLYHSGRGLHLGLCAVEGPSWPTRFDRTTGLLDPWHPQPTSMPRTVEPPPGAGPLVSVVIPVRNGEATLPKTLAALAAQTLPPERYEVVVVDDGSTDATWALLENASLPCPLQRLRAPARGQSAATNRGIESARGRYVLLSAADILSAPDLLARHIEAHENAPDEIGVLGYLPYPREIEVTPFMRFITTDGTQFGYNLIPNPRSLSPRSAYAPNLSVSRSVLGRVGGFDEAFVFGMQDIDLGVRLRAAGVRLVLDEKAIGWHHHPIDLGRFLGYRQPMAGRGMVLFSRKWPELSPLPQLVRLCLLAYLPYRDHPELVERVATLAERVAALPEAQRPILTVDRVGIREHEPVLHRLYAFLNRYHFYRGVDEELALTLGEAWRTEWLPRAQAGGLLLAGRDVADLGALLDATARALEAEGKPFAPITVCRHGAAAATLRWDPRYCATLARADFNFVDPAAVRPRQGTRTGEVQPCTR